MKLSLAAAALALSLRLAPAIAEECSHGKLYISDVNSTTIHVFDAEALASAAEGSTASSEATLTAPGDKPLVLKATGSMKAIAAMFRGTADIGYTDGVVSFFDTGLELDMHDGHYDFEYKAPSEIINARFECARAIHYTPHDDKIAIFCDGSFEEMVNSTIWVIDETKFGSDESAIIFTETLQGSHHGVVVPVDDDHVMYSIALQDRIDRTEAGAQRFAALPATFVVTDYDGNEIHSIANMSSPDTSCSGFHGEWAHFNEFALACDAVHGGILRVDYDPVNEEYTSRALSYPPAYEGHRTGTFAGHDDAGIVVGNFAGGTPENPQNHLMAFEPDDTELTEDQIFTLPEGQCSFAFELGNGHDVLVMLPSGDLHIFEYDNGWKQLAKATIVEGGVEACSDMIFIPGNQQAFIVHKDTRKMYVVDLSHVDDGGLEFHTITLDFFPYAAAVSGAPHEIACSGAGHDEHSSHDHDSHDDDEHSSHDESGAPSASIVTAFFGSTLLATPLLSLFL